MTQSQRLPEGKISLWSRGRLTAWTGQGFKPLPFASARVVRDGPELLSLGTGLPILDCRTREEAHAEKRAHPGGGSLPDGRRQRSGRQRLLSSFDHIFRQLLIPRLVSSPGPDLKHGEFQIIAFFAPVNDRVVLRRTPKFD